jgi:zinc transporter
MNRINPAELGYGSDKHGLVCAFLFSPEERPRQVDADAALEWLGSTGRAGRQGFAWLHFSLSNAAAERWMRQSLQLPESFHESLRQSAVSTRLELEDDALMAVMHDVLFNSSFDAGNISTLTLYLKPELVVSARLRPLRSVDRLRGAVRDGQNLRSPAELLAQLLRDQAAVLVDIVRQSTARVDRIEDKLLAMRVSTNRADLSILRRSLVRLQRLLAPEPAALFRLLNRPPAWLSEADLGDLRQAAEEFTAAVADSAALTERLKLLQEELAALVNEHSNSTLFVLTLVTVLALPINVVAGLLGMNVGGIPFAQHPAGFFLIVCGLTLVTGVLAYFLLLRRRERLGGG